MIERKAGRVLAVLVGLTLLVAASANGKAGHKNRPPVIPTNKDAGGYDPARDPAKDLKAAIAEATKSNKRILMEVGGDWCVYCGMMDTAFLGHPALLKERSEHYVTLKVNFSEDNPNAVFLSQYPRIVDYPHFFVLDSNGKLIHSQPTHPFEHNKGKSYSVDKIDDFLKKWAQPPRSWLNAL